MTDESQEQPAWRRAVDWRTPDWCHESGVHWESWSLNGEACITGLDPPFAGGARLASCLTWLMRSFASHCRRTHDATGALAFECTGPRMPSTLAATMSVSFDLALCDPRLIRERVRRRGGDPASIGWTAFWLEGLVYDYVIGRDPFPPVGTRRRKLVVLAEERQVFVPARAAKLAAGVRRAWESGLDAVAGIEGAPFTGLLDEDEHAFLLNMLVLVHARRAANAQVRPPLEESYRRHERLIAELAPSARAKGLPVEWHALWRLPPAMTRELDAQPWMRYPAVSFVAAVRPLRSSECKAEHAAREKARREREAAEARERHLSALAKREAEAWRELDALIATKQPKKYEEAVALLGDLRDVCARGGRQAEAAKRIARLREEHTKKPSLIERFRKAGLTT